MTNYDVVKKLVGEIKPVGSSETDTVRLENLENMIELVECLMKDIVDVSYMSKHYWEASIINASKVSNDFIKVVSEMISDSIIVEEKNNHIITEEEKAEAYLITLSNGMNIKVQNKYKDSIFYEFNGDIILELRENLLFVSQDVWYTLRKTHSLNFDNSVQLLRKVFEKPLDLYSSRISSSIIRNKF